MDGNTITTIMVILIIIGAMIAVTRIVITENKKEREKIEWMKTTKCIICSKCSMGKMFCEDCLNRLPVIKKELPYAKTKDFDTLNKFKQELINKIIYSQSKYDREYNSIRLMAVSKILKEKYFIPNAINETATFLEEFSALNYITNEEFINKYADLTIETDNNPKEEEEESRQTYNNFTPREESKSNAKQHTETINQSVNVNNESTPFKDGCLKGFGGGCGCVIFIIVALVIAGLIIAGAFGKYF